MKLSPARTGLFGCALLGLVWLPACTPDTPQSRAQNAAVATCRARLDQIDRRQNRDMLSRVDTAGSPLSASGTVRLDSPNLAGLFQNNNAMADCVRGNQEAPPGASAPSPAAPAAPAPQAAPAP